VSSVKKDVLVVGNTAIDEFYRAGKKQYEVRGGNAYNAAKWFDNHGHEATLAAIIGSDYERPQDIDISESLESEKDSPRCRIHLNDESEPESRDWIPADFEETVGRPENEYDLVHLTAGVDTYGDAFRQADADIKALSPGGRIGEYDEETLLENMAEADIVFTNDEEFRTYENRFDESVNEIIEEYDIDQFFVTNAEEITLHTPSGVETFDVDVIENPPDTTGAGDAFANTYLSEILNGSSAADAIERGIADARETVLTLGSLPEFVHNHERRDSSGNIEREKVCNDQGSFR
jgi:sugar/nucleoside kinase (ribokinase family)